MVIGGEGEKYGGVGGGGVVEGVDGEEVRGREEGGGGGVGEGKGEDGYFRGKR